MLTSLGQLFDKIIGFCREQSEIIMIAGAALVVIIVTAAIIKSIVKKDKNEQDLNFDEEAYLDSLLSGGKTEAKKEESKAKESREKQAEKVKSNIILPEEILEEISKASSKDLQEVEIKIQSAELRIRYGGCIAEETLKEEVKRFGDEEPIPEEKQETEQTEQEEGLKEKIKPEELPEPAESRKVKFGPDNVNTTRSGRMFTEEELVKQIRD